MAQYNSPPKQKASKPDEFISFFDHLIIYFARHRNIFLLVVGAALSVLAIYALYRYQVSRSVETFAIDYMKAENSADADAIETWKNLQKKNPPAALPGLIALQMGGDYAKSKQWIEAAAAFQEDVDSSALLEKISQLAAAISLENAQQYSQANEVYQKLAQDKGHPFQYEARLGLARCQMATNQISEAETTLNQLISKESEASGAVKSAALNELIAIRLKKEQKITSPQSQGTDPISDKQISTK